MGKIVNKNATTTTQRLLLLVQAGDGVCNDLREWDYMGIYLGFLSIIFFIYISLFKLNIFRQIIEKMLEEDIDLSSMGMCIPS